MTQHTQEQVDAALSRAADENGYTEIVDQDSTQLAIDLMDRDVDFEDADLLQIRELVASWQPRRRRDRQ